MVAPSSSKALIVELHVPCISCSDTLLLGFDEAAGGDAHELDALPHNGALFALALPVSRDATLLLLLVAV